MKPYNPQGRNGSRRARAASLRTRRGSRSGRQSTALASVNNRHVLTFRQRTAIGAAIKQLFDAAKQPTLAMIQKHLPKVLGHLVLKITGEISKLVLLIRHGAQQLEAHVTLDDFARMAAEVP